MTDEGVTKSLPAKNGLRRPGLDYWGTTTLWSLTNVYDAAQNSGNIASQTVDATGAGGVSVTAAFGYDSLNRLHSSAETGAGITQTYEYDSVGNRWVQSAYAPSPFTPVTQHWYVGGTNQLTGFQYDAAGTGNLTGMGGFTFEYDAESRLKKSTINSATTEYWYDGDGRRVKKQTGTGIATAFVYDASGELTAEYGGASQGGTTQYLVQDHLGSTRMGVDGSGTVQALHDYLPFGEEIPAGAGGRTALYGGTDAVTEKFTGKERDAETGLDYFLTRYMSSPQGRFTSPDSYDIVLEMRKGRDEDEQRAILDNYLANPQLWNKYAYALNNPLKFTDSDGRRAYTEDDARTFRILQEQYDSAVAAKNPKLANAIAGVASELSAAIEAVPQGQKDPAGLSTALWAIGQIDNTNWGERGSVSFSSNGITVSAGARKNKCNIFVCAAWSQGGRVGLGPSGYPVTPRYRGLGALTGAGNALPANQVADRSFGMNHFPAAGSAGLGAIMSYAMPNPTEAHMGIYVGGGALPL